MAKIVYNIIINTGDLNTGSNGYVTYHKVHSIPKFKEFASNRYPKWKFATVYNNATKEKMEIIKRD